MHDSPAHLAPAAGKAIIGGGAVTVGVSQPSDYVSYFDRVYDLGWFMISGDDVARGVAVLVGVLVACNIVYSAVSEARYRRRRRND